MNLFAYGTLMWPEVLESVIGRRPAAEPAVLAGFRRQRVKGEHYPVMVRLAESAVEGMLYRGLTDEEFRHLDLFEGAEYDRAGVHVNETPAIAYLLSHDWKHIADAQAWEPEQLKPEHLAAFCAEYKGWKAFNR